MKKIMTDIKQDEEIVLRTLLDYSNVGSISQHKFSEFLKGFGPVHECVKNMKAITSAAWFAGFLSRYESDLVLRGAPVGTFLIRLSSSQPGSFALAFSTGASFLFLSPVVFPRRLLFRLICALTLCRSPK
jgi:SH2 domain